MTLDVAADLPPSGARIVVTIVGAALASGFYALNGYSPLLALLFAALAAGVTLGHFLTRPQATPLSPSDPVPRDDRTR